MKKVIGHEIFIYLKGSKESGYDLFGMLVDAEEDSIYLQCIGTSSTGIIIVPRENIKYCTTKTLFENKLNLNDTKKQEYLKIYVNKELIATIPVQEGVDLNSWGDHIIMLMADNKDIKNSLYGKIQKSIEYSPGEVYINVVDEEAKNNMVKIDRNPLTTYLNPSEMIERLNNLNRGPKNE